MLITRLSPITGRFSTMSLPIVEPHDAARLPLQTAVIFALTWLSPAQREFYATGVTPSDKRRLNGLPVFRPADRVKLGEHAGFIVVANPNKTYAVKLDSEVDSREAVPEASLIGAASRPFLDDKDDEVKPGAVLTHRDTRAEATFVSLTADGYLQVKELNDQFAEPKLAAPFMYGVRLITLEV